MSDKRRHDEYQARRELSDFGAKVQQRDAVAFNAGPSSETLKHYIAKAVTAYILRERGYRVDTEVEMPDGELDVLGYANGEGDMIGVELETNVTQDVKSRKIDQFYTNTPLRECWIIEVNDLPTDIEAMKAEIEAQL